MRERYFDSPRELPRAVTLRPVTPGMLLERLSPNGLRLSGARSGAERVRCSRGFGDEENEACHDGTRAKATTLRFLRGTCNRGASDGASFTPRSLEDTLPLSRLSGKAIGKDRELAFWVVFSEKVSEVLMRIPPRMA